MRESEKVQETKIQRKTPNSNKKPKILHITNAEKGSRQQTSNMTKGDFCRQCTLQCGCYHQADVASAIASAMQHINQ